MKPEIQRNGSDTGLKPTTDKHKRLQPLLKDTEAWRMVEEFLRDNLEEKKSKLKRETRHEN